jgi:hypothetical protein
VSFWIRLQRIMQRELLLKKCVPSNCQALCCYDGVYLSKGEANLVQCVVEKFPKCFKHLSGECVTYGEWRDGTKGLKTSIRPFEYTILDFPRHFNSTRCVFAREDHLCSLEVAARSAGLHRWTFKPLACWLFPLRLKDSQLVPPPLPDSRDPDYIDEAYPGFVTFLPCGKHQSDGDPWRQVLKEEIIYFEQADQLPLWTSKGLDLEEIIQLARVD